MKRGPLFILMALVFAGCASVQAQRAQSMEAMLSEAGFQIRSADTPEALASLQSLPPRKLLVRSASEGGESQYAYADPTGCKCLYVGTEAQYQALRKLQQEGAAAAEQIRDIRRRGALDSIWHGSGSLQY
jgi:hypothetical protein